MNPNYAQGSSNSNFPMNFGILPPPMKRFCPPMPFMIPYHPFQAVPYLPPGFHFPPRQFPQVTATPIQQKPVDNIEKEAKTNRKRKNSTEVVTEVSSFDRPVWTFTSLAILAIQHSPNQMATVDEIYKYIMHNFPFYQSFNYSSWTGTIRHNLTKRKDVFSRDSTTTRGGKWRFSDVHVAKAEIQKEIKQNQGRLTIGMKRPDQFAQMFCIFSTDSFTILAPAMSPTVISPVPSNEDQQSTSHIDALRPEQFERYIDYVDNLPPSYVLEPQMVPMKKATVAPVVVEELQSTEEWLAEMNKLLDTVDDSDLL